LGETPWHSAVSQFQVRIRRAAQGVIDYGAKSLADGHAVNDQLLREQELRALNEEYIRALLSGDVDWYRARLADDFVCIESDGLILDKAAFLRRTVLGSMLSSYVLEEVTVRLYGDVALVRGRGAWTQQTGVAGQSRYVDVYVSCSGDWKVVSAQITRVVRPV